MKKVIDNFELLKGLMCFNDPNDFYFVQIIQRKKDGCDVVDSGNNGYRRIKSYYITSLEDLDRRKDKIISLCRENNARAYIHINPRNAREIALRAIEGYAELLRENRAYQGYRVYDSMCGKYQKQKNKSKWIIDVDDVSRLEEIIQGINGCNSECPSDNILLQVHTPNGIHLITRRFDRTTLGVRLDPDIVIEIKLDSPTVLYYEGS